MRNPISILPEYATVQEAADFLGIHPESVRRLIRQGKLPGINLGNQLVIRWPELEAMKRRGYDGRLGRPSRKPGETNVRLR
ncbi:MAG: helix-turn-helix domain-containing protein [Anaerolineales bacterium]|uniref:helix-turn-helix domain-containing protein n=1 Tax=Promineifilum sp. TaxID=2664178 RepID=UPI001DC7D85F|nr:helix-turn-helix domain-containing protein [Anaerolineales bacterium]MCO5181131.1 helix-turn-helix domain-containing protein [Promineifilum sp.]